MSARTKFILAVICIIGYFCYLAEQESKKQFEESLYENEIQYEETLQKYKEFLRRDKENQYSPTPQTYDQIYYNSYQYPQMPDMQQGRLVTEPCGHCKSGWDPYLKSYIPTYGIPRDKVWCEICNDWDFPHTHDICRACGGTGSVQRYVYE